MGNIPKDDHEFKGSSVTFQTSLQENIITTMAYDDEYGRVLVDQVDCTLFDGDYRTLAGRIIDYWREYNKAPGKHTPDLVSDIIDDPNNRRANSFKRILHSMIRLAYEDSSFNPQFAVDKVSTFHRQQQAKELILHSAELMDRKPDGSALPELANLWREFNEGTSGTDTVGLISVDEFEECEVEWFWEPFFPFGMLSVVAAEKGKGKTSIIIDMAAKLSKQGLSTVYFSKEDSPQHALRPLMRVAGGDVKRLKVFGIRDVEGNAISQPPDKITPAILDRLEREIVAQGDVGMVAVEPLNSFIDSKKANDDAGIRELLDRLAMLANRHAIIVIVSTHWNKNTEARVRDRIIGSVGIINTARSVNVIIDDPDEPSRRLLVNLISNLVSPNAPNARGFEMRSAQGLHKVVWAKKSTMDNLSEADVDAMVVKRSEKPKGRPRKQEHAMELLRDWLEAGPRAQRDVEELAKQHKIGWRTILTAKAEMGLTSSKRKDGWYWEV